MQIISRMCLCKITGWYQHLACHREGSVPAKHDRLICVGGLCVHYRPGSFTTEAEPAKRNKISPLDVVLMFKCIPNIWEKMRNVTKKKKKTSGQSLCVRKTWVMSRKTSNRRGEWFKVYKRQIPGVSQQWFLIQAHVTLCLWGCVSIDLPLRCYKRQASTTKIQPLIIWTALNVRLVSPAVFEILKSELFVYRERWFSRTRTVTHKERENKKMFKRTRNSMHSLKLLFQPLDSQEILKELWGFSRNPVLLGEPGTAIFRSECTRGTFRGTLLKRFMEDLLLMFLLEKEKFVSLYLQLVRLLQVSLVFDVISRHVVQKSRCVRL